MNLVNKILQYINENKRYSNISIGNRLQSVKEMLEFLFRLTQYMEKSIDDEHSKMYWTDDQENEFRKFTTDCMTAILIDYKEVKEFSDLFTNLCVHRHWGYGFFMAYEQAWKKQHWQEMQQIEGAFKEICSNNKLYKALYMSLALFYKEFYGNAYDNENAIKMICKYYRDRMNLSNNNNNTIVSALKKHIDNAGVPGDRGYAYRGIATIEQYIKQLPEKLVLMLLGQNTFNYLASDHVYRHQIYAVVSNGFDTEDKRRKYKFFFLDSAIILGILEDFLYRHLLRSGFQWKPVNWKDAGIEEETVRFFINEEGKECSLRSDLKSIKRTLIGEERNEIFCIELKEDIVITYRGTPYEIKFDPTDWMLNDFLRKEFCKEVEKGFTQQKGVKGISLLYTYFNHYRGLEKQDFIFDSRYKFDPDSRKLAFSENDMVSLSGMYGSKIDSLFCIVGKNGVGKTSFVDFLCDCFLSIIEIMDSTEKELREILEECGIGAETEMLVVFEYAGNTYMFTNIENVDADEKVIPYESRGLLTHSWALSKVFYFSGKVDIGRIFPSYTERDSSDKWEKWKRRNKKKDYSEMADLQYRYQYMSTQMKRDLGYDYDINKSLCYQLFFLRAHSNEKLQDILWEGVRKEDFVLNESKYQEIFLKLICNDEEIGTKEEKDVKRFLCDGRVVIQHFSSGQYEKFAFLSNLFWILKGYKEFEKVIKIKEAVNAFSYDGVIKKGDSALLFIDEGDLYYHPEWQREYVNDLQKMIKDYSDDSLIQIVISTNSPFILSDILSENITYIPKENVEKRTFGQNIHTLLQCSFFMKYTIGEFARNEIVSLLEKLAKPDINVATLIDYLSDHFRVKLKNEKEVYIFIQHFIDEIGEEVYRYKLQVLLDNVFRGNNREVELERLKHEKKMVEEKIREIEERE